MIVLWGCSSAPHPTVLYVSESAGRPETWVFGPDRPTRRLVDGSSFPADPDPKGELALLVRVDEHAQQLWTVDLGSDVARPLAPPAGVVRNPAWSPDGAYVVFESDVESFRDLYRVDRDGTGLRRLTTARFGSFEPAVSPDGSQIAFGSSRDGNAEIYTMAPDGTDVQRITDHRSDDTHPRWLPDGRLVWLSSRQHEPRVWVTGPAPLRPAERGSTDLDFAVSPQGALAIVVRRGTEIGIELGGRWIDGPGPDEHPAWSPDGQWLVFTSSRAGDPDLWRIDRAGDHPTRLTTGSSAEWLPRWLGP